MNRVLFLLSLFFLFSCFPAKNDSNKQPQTSDSFSISDVEDNPSTTKNSYRIVANKINLDSILINKNLYLASLNDSTLSLCCYDILDITQSINYQAFEKSSEEYEIEGQTKKVTIYSSGTSFLKEFENNHPQVMETQLVCGRIKDNHLISNSTVQIGMKKNDLLSTIFQPTEIFEEIKQLDIFENEISGSTSYHFENNLLVQIVFNSDYDWIDKELK